MKPYIELIGQKVKLNASYKASQPICTIVLPTDIGLNELNLLTIFEVIENNNISYCPYRPEVSHSECKYYRLDSHGQEELSNTPFEDNIIDNISLITYQCGDIVTTTDKIIFDYPNHNYQQYIGKTFQINNIFEHRMPTFNANNTGINENTPECDCCSQSIFAQDFQTFNIYKQHIRKATRDEINLYLSQQISGPRILGQEVPITIEHKPIITNIPNGYKGEVLNIILNSPQRIPILKQSCSNRKYHDKVINSILPFKIGVEIECYESLSLKINKNHPEIIKQLNCVDYSDDCTDSNNFCEHRICFNGHKQVVSLYNLCLLLQKNCTINTTTGIHYHFDMPEIKQFNGYKDKNKIKLVELLTNELNNINTILNYKGDYNRKKVGIENKGTWVNIRSNYFNTIEIRTAGPSFDYTHIISEIIELSKIIQKIRTKMNFKEYRL